MPETEHADTLIDAPAMLQLVNCKTCGIAFAVPALLLIERQNASGVIYCPNGHAIQLEPVDEATLLAAASRLNLIAKIAQLEMENSILRVRCASVPLAQPKIDAKELRRRARLLAGRSKVELGSYGRKLCRFCGKSSKSNEHLAEHFIRQHAADLEILDPSFLE